MKTLMKMMLATTSFISSASALAVDIGNGYDIGGYFRVAAVSEHTTDTGNVNRFTLGKGAEEFRLGNEGDTYGEILAKKTINLDNGVKWTAGYIGAYWNPSANLKHYSADSYYTRGAYIATSGYAFSPETEFWAGRRYIERADVHIVDHQFFDVGGGNFDNGLGATNIPLWSTAKLGLSVFRNNPQTDKTLDDKAAYRFNADMYDIPVAQDSKLRVAADVVHGNFAGGDFGGALTVKYDKANFILSGITNSLWLQGSTGYASLENNFGNLKSPTGTRSGRVIDSVNWQLGEFGGQALAEYQRGVNENTSGGSTGTTFGGRVSYAVLHNVKLLSEMGWTTLGVDGGPTQRLNKYTAAIAYSTGPDFWTRPELRFYVTHVDWNNAALDAQQSNWGAWSAGKHSTNMFGVQLEHWW